MSKIPLNKLKNSAMNMASVALLRVELATEESKLKKRFQLLGQKLHGAVRDDLLAAIKDDPSVVELLGAIEEQKRRIKSLRNRIDGNKDEG
ncbi:MAG: hypothetical protein MJY98_05235 [Fibrobacter sp.]|nr:hypothetical protein [Fibrobacter sp.]